MGLSPPDPHRIFFVKVLEWAHPRFWHEEGRNFVFPVAKNRTSTWTLAYSQARQSWSLCTKWIYHVDGIVLTCQGLFRFNVIFLVWISLTAVRQGARVPPNDIFAHRSRGVRSMATTEKRRNTKYKPVWQAEVRGGLPTSYNNSKQRPWNRAPPFMWCKLLKSSIVGICRNGRIAVFLVCGDWDCILSESRNQHQKVIAISYSSLVCTQAPFERLAIPS